MYEKWIPYETNQKCEALLKKIQWPSGRVSCPRCKSIRVVPKGKYWRCRNIEEGCLDFRFSVTSTTPFAGCRELHKWFKIGFWIVTEKPTTKPTKRGVAKELKLSPTQAQKIIHAWKTTVAKMGKYKPQTWAFSDEAFLKALRFFLENDYRDFE